jgi:DNA ligase (NAD+)
MQAGMAKFLGGSRAARRVRVAVWAVALGVSCLRIDAADADGTETGKRIEALRAEIAHNDELYFKKAAPEISDEAYDRLKRELAELERSVGIDPETRENVGDDRSGRFPAWKHGERMLSLEKVYSEAELKAFVKRAMAEAGADVAWVLEPKYDGLAVSATYEHGRLVRLATRGNGIEGDDVTANAGAIASLPARLGGENWPARIELRGEVYVKFNDFERVNAERAAAGETTFANPRALAAGSLKLIDPGEVAERGLAVVFYGWGQVEPVSATPASQVMFHAQVKAWGLPGVDWVGREEKVDALYDVVRVFGGGRRQLAYPIDGVVLKMDDVLSRSRLGVTEHAPRWAVAYKFAPERVATRLKAITVQVGRTGLLTPVAELEPVVLGGSSIARATLHNEDEIAGRDIRVGDVVFLEKTGEVIPAIVGVDRSQRPAGSAPYLFPADCPVCGAAVVIRNDDGGLRYCPNKGCSAQVIGRLKHFFGAQGIALDGFGAATIEAAVKTGIVHTPADVFRMTRDEWLALPGVGGKTADRLVRSVEAAKHAEPWRLINGLGIPRVGGATARVLAAKFRSLDGLAAASRPELAAVSGIGPSQADAVAGFFSESDTVELLGRLRQAGVDTGIPGGEHGVTD